MCFDNSQGKAYENVVQSQYQLTGQLPDKFDGESDDAYQKRLSVMGYGGLKAGGGGLLGQAPKDIPDFSDPNIQKAYQSQVLSQGLKRGRSSTFLSFDSGGGQPATGNSTILGG